MSESKKMGAAKYKNNKKYKNKSKVVPKENQIDTVDDEDKIVIDDDYPFRRRGLESNWHRYEVKDELEEEIDVAKDFSAIISAPISQGNYFKFKGDKNLDSFKEEEIKCDMFKIDMNSLSLSLLSIPFHIRCGIDEKYLSDDSLNVSFGNAEQAKLDYIKMLEKIENEKKLEEETKNKEDKLEIEPLKEENDEKNVENQNKKVPQEKEDLEKWLDDILDD